MGASFPPMATAQFAMVEELASLVKDNLSCKHLVLSIEEALINFLQNDTSSHGILKLEPMSSYNRMLLHRLADIYGFAHESVGEGDDRHLILQRCDDSSIPCVLVSDILLQYDGCLSPAAPHQLLKRKEDMPALKKGAYLSTSATLEERKAAYFAARNRIFTSDEGDTKEPFIPKQRSIPVVAHRMIAHALGQRISSSSKQQQTSSPNSDVHGPDVLVIAERNKLHLNSGDEATYQSCQNSSVHGKICQRPVSKSFLNDASKSKGKIHNKVAGGDSSIFSNALEDEINGGVTGKCSTERDNIGAAKRMFAHALGRPVAKQI